MVVFEKRKPVNQIQELEEIGLIDEQLNEPEPEAVELTALRMAGAIPGPILTPEEILRIIEVRGKIEEALKTLSPKEEKIVRMCIMEDENLENIAHDMGISPTKLCEICKTALEKLKYSPTVLEIYIF